MSTKRFHISDVLSITSDRLVSSQGVGGVYEILNWLTNDNLMTHQLPRAGRECKPWLQRWFPELQENPPVAELDALLNIKSPAEACAAWCVLAVTEYGCQEYYELPQIPRDDHDVKNPLDELAEMVGRDRVIPVVVRD